MYQTPSFTYNRNAFSYEDIAFDMISRVPSSRILNMRFGIGQGKTFGLAAVAYIGAKYGMFDRAFYLTKDRAMVKQFQECFCQIVRSEEWPEALDKTNHKIEYAGMDLISSTFQSFGGYNISNYTLVLIDEAHTVNEDIYTWILPVVCRASCIITVASANQKYFLSP